MPRRCIVLGGTGAVGKHVLGLVLSGERWESVVYIGRRDPSGVIPDRYDRADRGKLKTFIVPDLLSFLRSADSKQAFQDADAVFCALGTTRGQAGSAEAFREIDQYAVEEAATASKEAGVSHFSLVTAQGANKNMWANDWGIFHGLLYIKVKGLAEHAVRAQEFRSATIVRPGVMDRGPGRRLEMFFSWLMGGIDVCDVAKTMVRDAEAKLMGEIRGETVIEGNKAIKRFAAEAQ